MKHIIIFIILSVCLNALLFSQSNLYYFYLGGGGSVTPFGGLIRINPISCSEDTISKFNRQSFDFANDSYSGNTYSSDRLIFSMRRIADDKIGLFCPYFYQNNYDFIPITFPGNGKSDLTDIIYNPLNNKVYGMGFDYGNNSPVITRTDLANGQTDKIHHIQSPFCCGSDYIRTRMALCRDSDILYLPNGNYHMMYKINVDQGTIDSFYTWQPGDSITLFSGIYYEHSNHTLIGWGRCNLETVIIRYNLHTHQKSIITRLPQYNDSEAQMAFDYINGKYIIKVGKDILHIDVSTGQISYACTTTNYYYGFIGCPLGFGLKNEQNTDMPSMIVYPNPTSGKITVSGASNQSNLQLFDLQGNLQTITVNNNEDETTIQTNINAGVYILKITEGERCTFNKIMIY